MSLRIRFTRLTVVASIAVAAACGGGGGGSTPGTPHASPTPVPTPTATPSRAPLPTFSEPPVVQSIGGSASFALTAETNPATTDPAFLFAGALVPPTVEVSPGDTIRIAYDNALAAAGTANAHGFPDDSNLHFHGFTTSPLPPGDDVIDTLLAPGQSTNYAVAVNPDQPPGLYWYHTHPHGESTWQNDNGLSGMIEIDGIQNEVPAVGGLRERLLIVRNIGKDPASESRRLGRLCGLSHLTPAERERVAAAEGFVRRPQSQTTGILTVNGQVASSELSIGIAPGEQELIRVVNATSRRTLDLSTDGAPLHLISRDGVPFVDYAGGPSFLNVPDEVLPPAGRAEFIVTGRSAPFALRSNAFDSGPSGDPNVPQLLVVFQNNGDTSGKRLPAASFARARRPLQHPRPLLYRQPLPAPAAFHTIHFEENASGTIFYLNGKTYDPSAPPAIVSRSGTVEQWTLVNDTDEVHDFHIHQVHFILQSVNGVPVPASQQHWLDTFTVPYQTHNGSVTTPGTAVVTIDFRDPVTRGTFLFHCHIFDHEDLGMMASIQVL